ncbi:MAG TPA: VCBS repeat-containing protein [Candidatus Binatia bacterium]|nr:VCBS repeat-containing protein [Candidatus Binatia bacterium]
MAAKDKVIAQSRLCSGFVAAAMSVVAACSSPVGGDSVLFTHAAIDPAPDSGVECCSDSLALGDIDGDSATDIVLGSQGAAVAGLVWYAAPRWQHQAIARGEFTTDAAVFDIDGDGRLDVLAAGEVTDVVDGEGVFWFRHTGTTGTQWTVERVSYGGAHDVAAGDLDGDGRPEIVSCNKRSLRVSTVGANGEWSTRTIVERTGEGLTLADIDADGRLDIVSGTSWWKTPADLRHESFQEHSVGRWPVDTRVRAADINADGRVDIVVTVSEGSGSIAWFENPGGKDPWRRHDIDTDTLEGAHSLQVADMDNDGDFDVVTAEMHTSEERRVLVYLHTPSGWSRQVLATTGSHNLAVADLDGDGDFDIVGKNYGGDVRGVEAWINGTRSRPRLRDMDRWSYVPADTERPDDQQRKTGLVFADLDRDRLPDVIAGGYAYFNPGRPLKPSWRRERLPGNPDTYHAADFDADGDVELLAADADRLVLIDREPATAPWTARVVAELPAGRTQGYGLLRSDDGTRALMTRGSRLLLVEPPPSGSGLVDWTVRVVSTEVEEEGLAIGDIDRDGDDDIAATARDGERHLVVWLENPGTPAGDWRRHVIADGPRYFDRVALAHIDDDARLDIVVTEESRTGIADCHVQWIRAPENPAHDRWDPHVIAQLRSLNSLDVADMDDDGDTDIVVGEHTDLDADRVAPDTLTAAYENLDNGMSWRQHVVDRGPRSSHLGTRLVDLDADGDSDIVSIAWHQFEIVHVWRNDAPLPQAAGPR